MRAVLRRPRLACLLSAQLSISAPPLLTLATAPPPSPHRPQEGANWDFYRSLPNRGDLFAADTVRGSQFQQPLMEFSGACEGCGETPYVKLLTQVRRRGAGTCLGRACGSPCGFGGAAGGPLLVGCKQPAGRACVAAAPCRKSRWQGLKRSSCPPAPPPAQMFGTRMLVANATGCSSIWGGSAPANPYTCNEEGFGPAWANSLFEDNAQFGFGIALGLKQRREALEAAAKVIIEQGGGSEDLRKALAEWIPVKVRRAGLCCCSPAARAAGCCCCCCCWHAFKEERQAGAGLDRRSRDGDRRADQRWQRQPSVLCGARPPVKAAPGLKNARLPCPSRACRRTTAPSRARPPRR